MLGSLECQSMVPVRIIVIDDDPSVLQDAVAQVNALSNFTLIGTCKSVKESLTVIPATQPDVVLLDIQLGDGTGFDILESLGCISFHVIFLTAHQQHAIKAIKHGAIDYLLKPLDPVELKIALQKVQQSDLALPGQRDGGRNVLMSQDSSRIVICFQNDLQVIEVADILYCHGQNGYTTFFLSSIKHSKITASKNLGVYEALLPSGQFLRVHNSYVVNTRYIDKYRKAGELVLKDGTEIPVAFRRRDLVSKFLSGKL